MIDYTEAAMRTPCRELFRALLVPAFVAGAALQARAEGPLSISKTRLASAAETVAATDGEAAAVTDPDEREYAPAPAPLAEPEHVQPLPAKDASRPTAPPVVSPKPVQRRASAPPFRRNRASITRAPLEPPIANNQIRHALDFYGGSQARAALSQFPTRTPIQAGPQQPIQRQLKPFHTIYRDPTVSPYLNLYREENDSEGAPNYFAFVRPELEQIEANRTASRKIQQLSRQMQVRQQPTTGPQFQPTAASGRSAPARYMDTAQFYGGWSR
jgi:hypothetical protein